MFWLPTPDPYWMCLSIAAKVFEEFYNGCCNATFWPLFHSMPDRAVFSSQTWAAYSRVNVDFARTTLTAVRGFQQPASPAPIVWLHGLQSTTLVISS